MSQQLAMLGSHVVVHYNSERVIMAPHLPHRNAWRHRLSVWTVEGTTAVSRFAVHEKWGMACLAETNPELPDWNARTGRRMAPVENSLTGRSWASRPQRSRPTFSNVRPSRIQQVQPCRGPLLVPPTPCLQYKLNKEHMMRSHTRGALPSIKRSLEVQSLARSCGCLSMSLTFPALGAETVCNSIACVLLSPDVVSRRSSPRFGLCGLTLHKYQQPCWHSAPLRCWLHHENRAYFVLIN